MFRVNSKDATTASTDLVTVFLPVTLNMHLLIGNKSVKVQGLNNMLQDEIYSLERLFSK